MSKLTKDNSIEVKEENVKSVINFYRSLIKRLFLVSRSNHNIIVLEYLVFHGPKSFRQIALSTRLGYAKLCECLVELVRGELVVESVFSLSDKKVLKMYDVVPEIKRALINALSLETK